MSSTKKNPKDGRSQGKGPIKTRISKNLIWIEKYLLKVARQMPKMPLPRAIRSFKPNVRKRHLTLGTCCKEDKTITLATHTTKVIAVGKRKKRALVRLSQHEILQTLAHELSHLQYGEHGYEQEWYGKTIFNTFGLTEKCPHCNGKGKVPAEYRN